MDTAKPERVGFSSERLGRINAVMQRAIDEGKCAGILTMVARRGQIVHLDCFGMMDVEADKPMQPDAIFRIYSMSKPITSVAAMMLYE
ncbi:MAG: serine hydrolase domain-containing protein, partial [Anaerolineae bacterium]